MTEQNEQSNIKGAGRGTKGSISQKLILTLLPIITLTIVFIILFMSGNAKSIITTLAKGNLSGVSSSNANEMSLGFTSYMRQFDAIADSLARIDFETTADVERYLAPTCNLTENAPNGMYVALSDGTYIDASGWVPEAGWVATERSWYKEGQEHTVFAPGEPYVDDSTGDTVVTISRPVTFKNGKKGIAAVDYTISGIVDAVSGYKPLETGGSMLLAGDNILSYFNADYNGSTVQQHSDDTFLTKVAEIAKSGTSEVQRIKSYDGNVYYVSFDAVPNTNWTLISSVKERDVLKSLRSFQVISYILMVVIILVIGIIIYKLITSMVSKPVANLNTNIASITDGDFSIQIPTQNSNDEVASMNNNMKLFVEKMRGTLQDLQAVTDRLSAEADSSSEASKILYDEAEDQSNSMEQIKMAIDGMAQAVTELAENATDLATAVDELTKEGESTGATMSELVTMSKDGQEDMNKVQSGMESIVSSMSDMNDSVTRVGESAQKINNIISMINSIASQTNLLSLNASIEAARAGEAGKGFAVVAGEIGSLATNSAEATSQIEAIIREVLSEIQTLSTQSAANMEEISENAESVKIAGETFEKIVTNLGEAGATVAGMIKKMSEVDNIASSMAAISEEQSASTEEISATVETLATSATNVASKSKDVAGSADTVSASSTTIKEFVDSFTL